MIVKNADATELVFPCAMLSYFSLEDLTVLAKQRSGCLCLSLLSQPSAESQP